LCKGKIFLNYLDVKRVLYKAEREREDVRLNKEKGEGGRQKASVLRKHIIL
jgi:hypothetical protein